MLKFNKSGLLILFVCLISSLANAQPKVPENVFYQKLNNGLEVMVIEDHTIPFTTIQMACKNGSFTEDPEFNGLSHLYEHMFFKANKDYRNEDLFWREMDNLDMSPNGETREELVTYYFTLPKENTQRGLAFMNSAIRYPKFKKAEMIKENKVVDAEFQRKESNPYFILIDTLDRMLWGKNYTRKNVIGNHDIILNATPQKMEIIQDKFYHPNNCLLIVGGDVNHADIFPQVEKIFGSWKNPGFDPAVKFPYPEIEPLKESKKAVIASDLAESAQLILRWHGPDMRNDIKATYTADVFSFILNQRMSKLTKAFEDAGLAHDVSINYYSQKYVGPITFSLSPNPAKIKECYKVMQQEMQKWDTDDYITDQQIERAKRQLYVSQVEDREEVERYASLLAFWWACTTTDYYTFYKENLDKVTREDMKEYVRKYIKGKPFVAGLIIPRSSNLPTNPDYYFSN